MFKCKTCSQKFAVSWNKLFFSCCLLCISMTRAFWCQYALETKPVYPCATPGIHIPCRRYTGIRRHREVCAKPVYRRATPQASLRKAGIPACDVLRVKNPGSSTCLNSPIKTLKHRPKQTPSYRDPISRFDYPIVTHVLTSTRYDQPGTSMTGQPLKYFENLVLSRVALMRMTRRSGRTLVM